MLTLWNCVGHACLLAKENFFTVFSKKLHKKTNDAWNTKGNLFAKLFLWMVVTFRDESNEPSSIMIGYSDTTVTALNHPLIVRSKTSLARATATIP